ncbi:MAG: beta-ketoacyl synthase chain length factor [Zoogloeaceae bacterium]|nr:beta-ketoacyl synthase chain length factor [Zoogloeaceae bacterium]
MALTAWIEGVGFIAPGLPDWVSARSVLRGEQPFTPAPSVLPPADLLPSAERRRASRIVKVALATGLEAALQAGADVSTLATVFSASGADGHNCHALCEQLASEDRQISPTRFHNSVHNAAAGYWGIATRSMAPCQVISAFDASFGAGLLDALGQVVLDQQPTLLIAYDSEYPEPIFSKRPLPDVAGVALLLSPTRSARSLARITASPTARSADPMVDPALEAQRLSIPALRALPLLAYLARGVSGEVCLDYLPPMQLSLMIDSLPPC